MENSIKHIVSWILLISITISAFAEIGDYEYYELEVEDTFEEIKEGEPFLGYSWDHFTCSAYEPAILLYIGEYQKSGNHALDFIVTPLTDRPILYCNLKLHS